MNERLAQTPNNWPGRTARTEEASFTFPWIVAIKYWWAVGPTGGEGGTKFYISLFGTGIPIRNRIEQQS